MRKSTLSHLSDATLSARLTELNALDRDTTSELLEHIAEFDSRKLYLPAGYPSMYAYCVGELRMSEDVAFKRIRVARMARRFPRILADIREGRLHLSGLYMLTPHVTQDNAAELVAATRNKTKAQIRQILAELFPEADLPPMLQPVTSPSAARSDFRQLAPGPVATNAAPPMELVEAPAPVGPPAAPSAPAAYPRVAPLAPERFGVQFTIGKETHELLCEVQALLGHQVPSGDLAIVFHRALEALKHELAKQKYAETDRPRPGRPRSSDSRHIPADVKRAVWERDGGRCTFVSRAGHRCEARTLLEFDHVNAFARGGQATIGGIRLRCRAHNQYEAECTFGVAFMNGKRDRVQDAARSRSEARSCDAAVTGSTPASAP